MICLPNRKRAFAVSSILAFVRKRIGAPLMIIVSPWRSSRTRLDMTLDSVCDQGWSARHASAGTTNGVTPGMRRWSSRLLEQTEERLRRLVRDRQGLGAVLLPYLQGLQLSRFLRKISVNQGAEAAVQRIDLVIVVARLVSDEGRSRTVRIEL